MKSKLLMSTAVIAFALGTATAGAQTKSTEQTNLDRNGNPVRVIDTKRPDATTGQAPAASTSATTPTSTATSATPAQNTTTPANAPAATASQPAATPSAQPSSSTQPSTAQSATPPNTTPSAATNTTPSTATNTTPSANQPAAAQSTQSSTTQPSTAAGAAPAQPNTAQQNAPAANQAAANNTQAPVKLSASLQAEQKTRLTQAFTSVDMKPVNNVNFSLTIGTAVPRTVEFRPLPASVVAIIPQYRGYNYVLVRNEIVIIEPGTSRIVDIIERDGSSQVRTTTTTTERKVNLSKQQRDYIREHSTRRATSTTTGSAPRTTTRRVVVGDEIPETVEIETFPEEVYREVPAMRSYRYMRGERGIYLVDPQRRTIIEDLDD